MGTRLRIWLAKALRGFESHWSHHFTGGVGSRRGTTPSHSVEGDLWDRLLPSLHSMPLLNYSVYPTKTCPHCEATLDMLEACPCVTAERRRQEDLDRTLEIVARGQPSAHLVSDPAERAAAIKRILARTD